MFRARFLAALHAAHLPIPAGVPGQWVVDCTHVGQGPPALEYLSRYLYRGVISEKNIVANQNGNVTFRYTQGRTGQTQTRTLKGEDFLWLVLQHVKDICLLYRRLTPCQGLSNHRIRSWLASRSRSILIRSGMTFQCVK